MRRAIAYIARTVGVIDPDEVEVPPLEDKKADDRAGVLLHRVVGKDDVNVGVDGATPRVLAVHPGAASVVVLGLVLLGNGALAVEARRGNWSAGSERSA